MFDQLGGIRDMIERQGLPPRLRVIVDKFEKRTGHPIEKLSEDHLKEVRQIAQLVDGNNLIAVLVATMGSLVPDDELPQPEPVAPVVDEDETPAPPPKPKGARPPKRKPATA